VKLAPGDLVSFKGGIESHGKGLPLCLYNIDKDDQCIVNIDNPHFRMLDGRGPWTVPLSSLNLIEKRPQVKIKRRQTRSRVIIEELKEGRDILFWSVAGSVLINALLFYFGVFGE